MIPITNHIKKWIMLSSILAILITQNLSAQIQSATSGDWYATTTWVGGVVPSSTDDIEILVSHIVTLSAPATIDMPGNLDIVGTLNLNHVIDGTASKHIISGGILNSSGGTMSGSGEWIIEVGGTLNVNTASYLGSTTTLRNHGTFNWLNGHINEMGYYSCYYGAPPPSFFINESDGTWNINLSSDFHLGAVWVTNHGVINKTTSSTLEFHNGCAGSTLNNTTTGTINVLSGQITFNSGNTVLNGNVNLYGTMMVNSAANIGASISLEGTLTLNSISDFSSSVMLTGSGVLNISSSLSIPDNFVFTIPTINLNGSITGAGIKTYASGVTINLNGGGLTGFEHVIQSGAFLTIYGGSFGSSTMIRNQGTINWQSGFVNEMGPYSCYYGAPPPAIFINEVIGIVNLNQSSASHLGATHTTNHGVFNKTNSSLFTFHSGCSGSPFTNAASGEIKGIGTIQFDYGFTNLGTIAPGLSTGELTLNFASVPNKVLDIQIASSSGPGTGHDRLNVNGNFIATGTLNVSVEGSYNPSQGTSFEIVSASGTITDQFTTINFPAGMEDFLVTYNAQSIVLTRGTSPPPCEDSDMDTYTTCAGDCDDTNAAINPAATEICNGVDDDCDGLTDEGCLIAHWKFSNNFDDETNNNTAAESGGVIFDDGVGCDPLEATLFDGGDDHISIGNLSLLENASSLSVSVWVRKENNSNYAPGFVGKWNSSGQADNTFLLYNGGWGTDNKGHFAIQFNDNSEAGIAGSIDLPIGEWTHLVGVWNSSDGFIGLYKNGALEASSLGNGTGKLLDYSTNFTAKIGAWGVLHGAYTLMKGGLDNVRIYSDALDAGEVLALYNLENLECDDDGDSYTEAEGDCDDSNPNVNPGATEICNTLDDDCDGEIDEGGICNPDIESDLVGYWMFNNNLQDETPNNNTGNGSGGVHYTSGLCGNVNGALEFDGIDDNVVIADHPSYAFDVDPFSVTYWISTVQVPGIESVITMKNNGNNSDGIVTFLNLTGNGNVSGRVSGGQDVSSTGSQLNDGNWHHIVYTREGTSQKIFVDGTLNNTASLPLVNATTPYAIVLGLNSLFYGGFYEQYAGKLDNFRLYARALSNADVTALFDSESACPDLDLDGFSIQDGDCDDNNIEVYPGADEICNGIDDDCDGLVDDVDPDITGQNVWYADTDEDGYGDLQSSSLACNQPLGAVANGDDCDDTDADIHPGATEICNTLDDDCDGQVDEGVQLTYYQDSDQDGYGNGGSSVLACSPPGGYVDNALDCNDADANVFPGSPEVCNLMDDDCDGMVDEGVLLTFYADTDNDGYGDPVSTVQACSAPSGYVDNGIDCNDTNNTIYPGATETCNLIDDDCDGTVDEGVQIQFFADTDADGYGNVETSVWACTLPSGYSTNAIDCDDTNGTIHPGATEICNLVDDNCDGFIDEGVQNTYYLDADDDSYGDPNAYLLACTAPAGYVTNGDDCDDIDEDVHPGARELCNDVDDDCNGEVDEDVQTTFYADADADGYGDPGSTVLDCTLPSGYVDNALDCDDTNPAVNPGMDEVCNLIDDDCDGLIDEGVQLTFFADADGDGFGDSSSSVQACSAPTGFVANDIDCDDTNAAVNPSMNEVCNLIDDDCDGLIDEGVQQLYYEDQDHDGFGNVNVSLLACTTPVGYVSNHDDCIDTNGAIHPGALEVCNSLDDDCDGQIDETFDLDGDGYGACNGDCNDLNPAIHPGATELCNNLDDDCDGIIDDGVTDSDGDGICNGFDNCPFTYNPDQADNENDGIGDVCDPNDDNDPRPDYNDCAPFDPTIYPGAPEICGDLIDNDCDNKIDDPLSIQVLIEQDVLCNGSASGTISISGQCGLPPYSYHWNNGGNASIITNLVAGQYKVTVTDAQGLTRKKTFNIQQPSALNLNITHEDVSCNGDNDGSAKANVNGGNSPYTYLWSNGATTKKATSLYQGIYTVTVTDENGCTKSGIVEIEEPTAVDITNTVVSADPAHPGKYRITVMANGGTPYNNGYRYRRCNAAGNSCSSWQVSNVLTNLNAGIHLVKVKDSNNCEDQVSVTIVPPNNLIQLIQDCVAEVNSVMPAIVMPAVANEIETRETETTASFSFTSVHPNPGKEYVRLNWTSVEIERINILVHDLSGRMVMQHNANAIQGMNHQVIDMSQFQSGAYIITLQNEHNTHSKIWIKTD